LAKVTKQTFNPRNAKNANIYEASLTRVLQELPTARLSQKAAEPCLEQKRNRCVRLSLEIQSAHQPGKPGKVKEFEVNLLYYLDKVHIVKTSNSTVCFSQMALEEYVAGDSFVIKKKENSSPPLGPLHKRFENYKLQVGYEKRTSYTRTIQAANCTYRQIFLDLKITSQMALRPKFIGAKNL
uniref:Uncharacterized protein n=1 Tax=Romanomermis culicivorax TaxID=13658 RepID=A0A915IQQ3_ROMCU